jgi:hypothetical protein
VTRKRKARHGRSNVTRQDSFQIGAPGAPEEGSDAGDATGLEDKRIRSVVNRKRADANRHLANAKHLVGHNRPRAESEARRAIDSVVRAFWWAEGSDLEDSQHELMHKIGRWTRRTFGCRLHFDGESYTEKCPIAIAHKRFGFSPGYTARHVCSICGDDLSECPHLRSRLYWVRGGLNDSGVCPICMQENCKRHRADRLYQARPVSIVTDLEGLEVSLVGRPANPEARLLSIPVSMERLAEEFGPAFTAGMPVRCDRCLGDCWGFAQIPNEDPGGAVGSVADVHVSDDGEATFDLEIE